MKEGGETEGAIPLTAPSTAKAQGLEFPSYARNSGWAGGEEGQTHRYVDLGEP